MNDAAVRADVVAVVLGYNHPDDTIECLASLDASRPLRPALLYVDNGSELAACRRVMEAAQTARVLRLSPNAGVGRGFNAGLRDALARGARYVLLVNNDVVAAPDMVARLVAAAEAAARAGIVVPKIFYHAAPRRVWSAGSWYRRWPPTIVLRRTRGDDDGALDDVRDLEFATFCVALFRRELFEEVGLLDTDFHVFQEDYDLCLRARAAGWSVRYEPAAHVWHKVSLSTRTGSRNPESWRLYGRSEALFARKHPDWPWLTGPVHRAYVTLRILAERKPWGLRPFLQGYREGLRAPLNPPPRPGDPPEDVPEVLRTGNRNGEPADPA
ncbi:MAG: glycosyltransferase family 2 protein [Kiritimatiellae bacterium]|nr:glycosyltransferase family 2 protein [Kiritimatiellia bacterium]